MTFKYLRLCRECGYIKPSISRFSKNGKTVCLDCLDERNIRKKKTIKCLYCNDYDTKSLIDFFNHIIDCEAFKK